MRRSIPLAAALATAALVAAGCGSSSNDNASTTSGSGSSGAASSNAASSGGGAYGAMTPSQTQPTPTSSGPATVKTTSSPLGTILVDGSGRTLYLFERDTTSKSTCAGSCATDWPPLTTTGSAKASGQTKASMLGTTRRADGTTEVTYAGHPLYYYIGDGGPGDTNGQNIDAFGAEWYVLAPSGHAIKTSGS
jgi:predicted lipoprotein with Yx(FWY)xxD motif